MGLLGSAVVCVSKGEGCAGGDGARRPVVPPEVRLGEDEDCSGHLRELALAHLCRGSWFWAF